MSNKRKINILEWCYTYADEITIITQIIGGLAIVGAIIWLIL